jgi:hypothetical protein
MTEKDGKNQGKNGKNETNASKIGRKGGSGERDVSKGPGEMGIRDPKQGFSAEQIQKWFGDVGW